MVALYSVRKQAELDRMATECGAAAGIEKAWDLEEFRSRIEALTAEHSPNSTW